MDEQLKSLGIAPRYVASLTQTDQHLSSIIELIAPRGHLALIDDLETLDILPMKLKAITVSWEFMFTRSMFKTHDMDAQHALLNTVSELLDSGALISTVNHHAGKIGIETLRAAHELQESGKAIGKTVLDGFG